jgi:hypothetical protein
MTNDDGGFPVFYVGDGPDPAVRVAWSVGLWVGEGDDAVRLPNPTAMALYGIRSDLPKVPEEA